MQIQDTNDFLAEVFEGRSKSRGVTVGVGVPEEAGDGFARALTAAYQKKQRYGLIKGGKGSGGWELYLVPQGKLAARLLKAFKSDRRLDEAALRGAGRVRDALVRRARQGARPRRAREKAAERALAQRKRGLRGREGPF